MPSTPLSSSSVAVLAFTLPLSSASISVMSTFAAQAG